MSQMVMHLLIKGFRSSVQFYVVSQLISAVGWAYSIVSLSLKVAFACIEGI